jgi:HEPN domain-containing protein
MRSTLPDDPSRTTPQGLLHFAEEFWRSAQLVATPELKKPEFLQCPSFVGYYLAGHAVELSLKAFLRASGKTLEDLRSMGHNLSNCLDEATKLGFAISPKGAALVRSISPEYALKRFEYIVTGVYSLPKWLDIRVAVEEIIAESAKSARGNLRVPEATARTSQP